MKTQTPYFSYQTFKDVRDHVYVNSAVSGTGFISFIVEDERKYKVIFNASEKRLQTKQFNDIIITNDESFRKNELMLDNLTAAILDITE